MEGDATEEKLELYRITIDGDLLGVFSLRQGVEALSLVMNSGLVDLSTDIRATKILMTGDEYRDYLMGVENGE